MPELPEVETIRLFLEKNLTNKTISNLEIITPKSFIGDSQKIIGQKIIKFTRLGKQLSLHLQNKLIILFHLKMTGQLVLNTPNKYTRVIIKINNNLSLYFNDLRKFGWVKVLTQNELVEAQKNIGIDILSPKFTSNYFYQQIQSTSRPIKSVLLDQSKFAGIGNIYANDALFLAKINPTYPSNQISSPASNKLHQSIIKIIKESIVHGGSTAKDKGYIKPDNTPGLHQFHFRVYQRDGQPCLICHTLIKKIKLAGRGTFYCPKCQK